MKEGGEPVLLVKPETFMNLSGRAVRQVVDFYKVPLPTCWWSSDDFNLPLGKLRVRAKGSHGGQNGLRDIQQQLGTDEYARLRIGVGQPGPGEAVDHVLSRFKPGERKVRRGRGRQGRRAVLVWVRQGIEACMNRVNGPEERSRRRRSRSVSDEATEERRATPARSEGGTDSFAPLPAREGPGGGVLPPGCSPPTLGGVGRADGPAEPRLPHRRESPAEDTMPVELYETLFLLDSDQALRRRRRGQGHLHASIGSTAGRSRSSRPWDDRKLSYPIKKQKKGAYYIVYYRMDSLKQHDLNRDLKLNEAILRYLTIHVDPKWSEAVMDVARNDHAAAFAVRGMQEEMAPTDVNPALSENLPEGEAVTAATGGRRPRREAMAEKPE